MLKIKKIVIVIICVLLLVGCDYTSKQTAKNDLRGFGYYSYLGGHVKFLYAENSGGMLGFGSNTSENIRMIIFRCSITIMLAGLFLFIVLSLRLSKYTIAALVLILGGGIGNLIDRFTNNGRVIDFIVISFINLNTGIFNIADLYITTGALLLVIIVLLNKQYEQHRIVF